MKPKTFLPLTAFAAILLICCSVYYSQMVYMWPSGIHAWAQADRLSLALNFYDHGMNFFKPRTHNIYSTDGITGVEFPIQSYLAALGGKILGREHISFCFRLLNVLITCTGLLFLFLTCYKATKDFVFSMFPPLFMFMSPILIYYTCSYIPDSAACALAFVSFYFIINYIEAPKTQQLIFAIAILTLASLIKTSVGLYLLGFLGFVFLQRISNLKAFTKKQNGITILAASLAISALVAYYLYNQYLNKHYGSTVFLAEVRPFKNWEQLRYFFEYSFKGFWVNEYLLPAQYALFVAIVVAGIFLLLKSTTGKLQLRLMLILLIGVACLTYLMGEPLLIHDYYAVSIYLPLFAFALVSSTIAIRQQIIAKDALKPFRLGLFSAVVITFFFADYHSHKRLQWGYIKYSPPEPEWYIGGRQVLNQLGIPADEKILVLYEDAPNTPLIYFDRRGYNVPDENTYDGKWLKEFVKKWNVQIVTFNATWENNISNDPIFQQHFEEVETRDRIAVYRLIKL